MNVEMLDVRPNAIGKWPSREAQHFRELCSELSSEFDYEKLWDYVVVKPKWNDLIGDLYIPEARETFQDKIVPVLLPVIGYSNRRPVFNFIEQMQQFEAEGWLGSPAVPINFMRGPSISRFLHLVRFIGIRYPDLAQGLSRLKRKEWRKLEEFAGKDGFQFEDTDYREYTRGGKPYNLLLPVWIRHRLAHPENKVEKDFPTESDYRRAFAILAAAIAGMAYSATNDNEQIQEEPSHD